MVCLDPPKSHTRYSLLVCLVLQASLSVPSTFARIIPVEYSDDLNSNAIGYGAPGIVGGYENPVHSIAYDDPSVTADSRVKNTFERISPVEYLGDLNDNAIGYGAPGILDDYEYPVDDSIAYDDPSVTEDSRLTTPELLLKYGYPTEVHHVGTADGYILEMHRVVNKSGIPVLLVHGLMDSSATWVMMGPTKGLAYLLHDLGYDVWMANVRGNTYSRNHTVYGTHETKFWDFSFHEMGVFDLPASIDHVLNATGHEQLHYIGHSQGTTVFWVMCSERPAYASKVLLMQALAPVAFVNHCRSVPLNGLAASKEVFPESGEFLPKDNLWISRLSGFLGNVKREANSIFSGSNGILGKVKRFFHKATSFIGKVNRSIVSKTLFSFYGADPAQLNTTMIPVILGHLPAGASMKDLHHFAQMKKSGHFRQYDYGKTNRKHYKSDSPPEYRLARVTAKVALHYSRNDLISTPEDVQQLAELLPNVVGSFLVDYADFNHADFVWAVDAKKLLYEKMFQLMEAATTL